MKTYKQIIPKYKYRDEVRVKSGFYESHTGHILSHFSNYNYEGEPDGLVARLMGYKRPEDSYVILLETGRDISEMESNIELCKHQ